MTELETSYLIERLTEQTQKLVILVESLCNNVSSVQAYAERLEDRICELESIGGSYGEK